jgi:hypothetical protein
MPIVALDIETGGIGMDCSVLEIAACTWPNRKWYHSIFKPEMFRFEPAALEMHIKNGLIAECLERGETGFSSFTRYIQDLCPKGRRGDIVSFAGCNVNIFDIPRIRQAMGTAYPGSLIRHRALEIGSIFWDGKGRIPSTDELARQYASSWREHRAHRAADDVDRILTLLDIKYPQGDVT